MLVVGWPRNSCSWGLMWKELGCRDRGVPWVRVQRERGKAESQRLGGPVRPCSHKELQRAKGSHLASGSVLRYNFWSFEGRDFNPCFISLICNFLGFRHATQASLLLLACEHSSQIWVPQQFWEGRDQRFLSSCITSGRLLHHKGQRRLLEAGIEVIKPVPADHSTGGSHYSPILQKRL